MSSIEKQPDSMQEMSEDELGSVSGGLGLLFVSEGAPTARLSAMTREEMKAQFEQNIKLATKAPRNA